MTNYWFLIVNPTSGNSNFQKKWLKIKQLLTINGIDFSYDFTLYSKHEVELVNNAIKKGFRNIMSVGGDGTLHHVVNGIMTQRYIKTSDITVAVLPIGTGNDWIKTYNIPKKIEKVIQIIKNNKRSLQDIGCLKLKDNTIAYFNNMAGLGYDGYVAYKLKKLKKLGRIAYLLSGLYGLLFYKKNEFTIEFNHQKIKTICLMTLFGICKFSGGGMQLTKNVDPLDGLLDITIAKNLTLLDLLLNIKKLYNGKIVNHKKVSTYKTNNIIVIPKKNTQPFIEADGEIIGTGSVEVSIIPNAIHFIIR